MSLHMDFNALPHFTPKDQKLLAAVLLVIEEAKKRSLDFSRGEIIKTIFIADNDHFIEYGRPVTFDNYIAMKNGPVGNRASDLLNGLLDWADFGLEAAPWRMWNDGKYDRYAVPENSANRKKLSPSDVDSLVKALEKVIEQGFFAISEWSHNHPAWKSAWFGRAKDTRSAGMDWRSFPQIEAGRLSDLISSTWSAG